MNSFSASSSEVVVFYFKDYLRQGANLWLTDILSHW